MAREKLELKANPGAEHHELAAIYVRRGLTLALATQVANQLMEHDALGAHARDELGVSASLTARPLQAAAASAGSFTVGALLPLAVAVIAPARGLLVTIAAAALVLLAVLGALAARVGGASLWTGAARVTGWGALAMAITAGVGALFGAA